MTEKIKQIRARKSYQAFNDWVTFLERKPSIAKILKKLHEEIDWRGGFGSMTNSAYAVESIKQLIKDKQLQK